MTQGQILTIVREHKDETVNIYSNKSDKQFLVVIKKSQTPHFLAFAKILSIASLSLSLSLSLAINMWYDAIANFSC